MRIAVNTRFLLNDYLEGYGYFVYETFKRITLNHPEHEFIFIFDRPFDQRFIFSSNIIPVIASPAARHPILWKWWYDVKVPVILKKYKAKLFVSADGFCSLTTKVPQCLVVHDLSFLHYPSFMKKSHLIFYKRYTSKFLDKANTVATVSQFSKQDILRQYSISSEKINVVYSASKQNFQPVSDEIKQQIKENYSGGKEYFLYTGAIHPRKNLLNLMKAFSIFKKRQQSSIKLLLAGRLAWKYDSFIKNLETYKYRDDVMLLNYLEESQLVKITASAYAVVYPSLFEGFGVPVLEAMQCEVPVITSPASAMEEIAGDAALYADPENYNDMAEKMMRLYKDESLRIELIQKGKNIARQYSWDRTAELLWETMQKALV
jgi:glycosyltransferase involved in cell wall biosynthesis